MSDIDEPADRVDDRLIGHPEPGDHVPLSERGGQYDVEPPPPAVSLDAPMPPPVDPPGPAAEE